MEEKLEQFEPEFKHTHCRIERDAKLFTPRNALIAVILSLVFLFTNGITPVRAQTVTVMTQNYGSIITDFTFSDTAYYKMLSGFFDGMQFSRSFNDAE